MKCNLLCMCMYVVFILLDYCLTSGEQYLCYILDNFVFIFLSPKLWGTSTLYNCISGIMDSMLALSAVDCVFKHRSGQTKDYKIGICFFSAKHATLRSKSKDWLVQNQNNVSEWSDMSTHRLLFQWTCTTKIQLSVLV